MRSRGGASASPTCARCAPRQFPEDAGPLAHPVRPEVYHEINNFYTPTVYEKGAEVVRMLKTHPRRGRLPQGHGPLLRAPRRPGGRRSRISSPPSPTRPARDLAQFRLWYSQAGTPEVAAKGRYDAGAQTYALTLSQSLPPTPGQSAKQPMHIPVALRPGRAERRRPRRYAGVSGGRVDGDVIHLTEPEQTFVFAGVSAPPVPSLLRGFSAPVKLVDRLTPDDSSSCCAPTPTPSTAGRRRRRSPMPR